MKGRAVNRRVLGQVRELTAAGLALPVLFGELHVLLRDVLGFDAGCWHECDPVTGALTSTVADGLDPAGATLAFHLELWSDDTTTFTGIRRAGRLVDTVARATGGAPARSVRYRDLLSDFGFTDELRMTFDLRGGYWGAAALMRTGGRFSAEAVRLAEQITRYVSRALLLQAMPESAEPPGPAVIVLGQNTTLVAATSEAQALLPRLPRNPHHPSGLPLGVVIAVEQAVRGDESSPVRLRTGDGCWLTARASRLGVAADGQVAVTLAPATPMEMVPLILLATGLSRREQEVAMRVVRGKSTKEIASLLHLSTDTVQDHLGSIFNKTGVRSRRELVALLVAPAIAEPTAKIPEIGDGPRTPATRP